MKDRNIESARELAANVNGYDKAACQSDRYSIR